MRPYTMNGFSNFYRKAALSGATAAWTRGGSQPRMRYNSANNTTNSILVTGRRKFKRGYRKSFKQRLINNLSAKHKVTSNDQTGNALSHNTLFTTNLTAGIVQGVQDDQRIGDSVHLLALKVNALCQSAPTTNEPSQVRIIIGYSGEEYNISNALTSAGLTFAEVFQSGTGGSWTISGIVNPKAFTVLDDRILTFNNYLATQQEIQQQAYTVQCDTSFPYQAKGSSFGKTRNLYMVVIGGVRNGVAGTTSAGGIGVSTDLIFKDLA